MSTLLANYEDKTDAFLTLTQSDCSHRILLFEGEGGTGKTTLLEACKEFVDENIYHLPIQLRGSAVGVAEIFSRSGARLGWERWSNFTQQVAVMTDTPSVTIDRNWLVGINNKISIALHAESPIDREQRRVSLTQAWFEDADSLDKTLLVMLDTYEQAPVEVAAWIDGPFLARAADGERLRVVVAGQKVPNPRNIEWGHCCIHHELFGVREAKYWLPVIVSLGKRVPVQPELTYLAGICHACNGRPDEIMKCIMSFPSLEMENIH